MGKDLKNREIGKGLSQRKDGHYSARFLSKTGTRKEKYFDTLVQARNWLDAARKEDEGLTIAPFEMASDLVLENDILPTKEDMTVDQWFNFWLENIVPDLRSNTLRNYKDRYKFNIKPIIGNLSLQAIKPMHCKKVLLEMEKGYSGSTIKQTYITMGTMFKAALMNDVISKHPMDGLKYIIKTKPKSDINVLSLDEQKKFLEAARESSNYKQYLLILETGLRTGELVALTWDSIDFENKTLTVDKSLEYRHSRGNWEAGPPKTEAGYRTIPLTNKAFKIFQELHTDKRFRRESSDLNQKLKFKDKITGQIRTLHMKELVFISPQTGMPIKNSAYDTQLYKLCEKAGIKHISMHTLRHTYATRAIERDINPKALQKLLGHATLQTTTDTYVHVTDDAKVDAVNLFESNEPAIFKMA
ncbi:MAG: tyrosine-type recombinase/integrase [Lachnospiraceae bacterium]|nr:tyrosine-type recombinase/integrase [Lachnospiraceae bacterium]